MKKKLLFCLIIVSLFTSEIFAQCQASFTWMQTTNNIISFTNTSTGTSINTVYHWTFGDAYSLYLQNPVHTYSIPGTYNVCLTITDSLGNCNSTFCDSIIVTGVVICNMTLTTTTTPASCGTCTDGLATAVLWNGTPPFSFSWNSVPPQFTPTASGLAPGTYTCCVTDVNGCTACNTATVLTSNCQANFIWMQTTGNTISFTNTSTGTTPFTGYDWTFGDNTQSFAQNPAHYYVVPGTYTVCLSINDSAVCSSTYCDTITVTGVNCNNLSITVAAVNASCPTCSDGSATASISGGTPPFTYLWNTTATTQSINNLAPGLYTCCVTDALGCTACANASVGGNCSSYFTVSYVSPQVYTGVNLATGAPPISYLWSWGDNTSSNTAYPTHTYASPGFYVICLAITDSLGCNSTYCDSFNIVRMATPFSVITINIMPPGPSGISNAEPINQCSVFPNPASDNLFIRYSLASSANTRIILYDMLGNVLRSFNDDMSEGVHEMIFDIANLEKGFYLLSLQSRGYSVTKPVSILK